jgi:hypothetical protein
MASVILALVVHPFFYAFSLLYIIITNPTLNKLIDSIIDPRKQILWTFGLLIGSVYMITLVYFYFYEDNLSG